MASFGGEQYDKRHVCNWEDGDAKLYVAGGSKPRGHEQPAPDVIRLCFHLHDVREVFDVPPQVRPEIHAPTIADCWSLSASTSFESTRAWASISAALDAAPRLPADASAYFKRRMVREIHAAVDRAERIQHGEAALCFFLKVRTWISYQDYLDFMVEENGSDQEEKGASEEAINRFLTVDNFAGASYGQEQSCSVCLDEIEKESMVSRMPCGHVFHSDCIDTWLKSRNSCPLCRSELPEVKHGITSDC